ncbi:hypothetical protein NHF46_01275 [Arthrobacter alpinus]|nr:hypothetical protein [Arthrobacter alpinus]
MKTSHRIGLIGDDLGTSLSPAIHQAEAAALGLGPYSYEAIDLAGIPEPDLRELLARSLAEGFTGFNVTHPYKQAIMAHLDSLDPTATALGAVNTVVVGPHGLTGHNTDHSGFLSGLRRTLPEDERHDAVVLFGAGGAGSAVAAALLDFGVRELRIIDTDSGRLGQLHETLKLVHPTGAGVRVETGSPGWPGNGSGRQTGWSMRLPLG